MYLMKFAILDVAVDNVFAQLIILFGIELSAAAPAEARHSKCSLLDVLTLKKRNKYLAHICSHVFTK